MPQKATHIVCTRCLNRFFTAFPGPELKCPYCGYAVKVCLDERRLDRREAVEAVCTFSVNGHVFKANVSDMSSKGVCLKYHGAFPYENGDRVNISISAHSIERAAMVVWVKRCEGFLCKAGLVFLPSGQ